MGIISWVQCFYCETFILFFMQNAITNLKTNADKFTNDQINKSYVQMQIPLTAPEPPPADELLAGGGCQPVRLP